MDLADTDEDATFRQEVRHFFDHSYPKDILQKVRDGQALEKEDHRRSQIALQSRGWFAVSWPKQYGGPGWSPKQRYIFDEELERAGAPAIIAMGVIYLGPLVCAFGSEWQKSFWLSATLNSEIFWAQGYSEANSGSDLASLSTRAERNASEYIITGQKIWTTQAHWADWMFCLARTSREARKQDGISIICLPMNAAGVKIDPIIGIDGNHHLNRVTLDHVRVPIEYRIGDEGNGWSLAKFVLNNERLSYAHISRKREDLKLLKALTKETFSENRDPHFDLKIASYEIALDSLEISVQRVLSGASEGASNISRLKIEATENAQKLTELFIELCGYAGLPFLNRKVAAWARGLSPQIQAGVPHMASYLFTRAQTIYGGTTEIQKDIVFKGLF